jgi:hypothetical protein
MGYGSEKTGKKAKTTNGPMLVWKQNRLAGVDCCYRDASPEVLVGVIDAVTQAGGAIMLGVTSDGGAFSVCVLHGDEKIKEYPHDVAELNALFHELIVHLKP